MAYRIWYTPTCKAMMAKIQQPLRGVILERIGRLATEPEKQGKVLIGPLSGCRSIHVSRYRVVYRVVRDKVEVMILAVALRKSGSKDDVYELAKRLVKTLL